MTLIINKLDVVGNVYLNDIGQMCPMGHFVNALGLMDKLVTDEFDDIMARYGLDVERRCEIYHAAAIRDYSRVTELFALAGHTVTFVD